MLCGQEVVLKAVTRERDQAVQALRTRGLHPEEEAQVRGHLLLSLRAALPPKPLGDTHSPSQRENMPNRTSTGGRSFQPYFF